MQIIIILKRMKSKFIKYINHRRAIIMGYDKASWIEAGCKIRNTVLEGKNHIGKSCQVYDTRIGIASGISRDSIIDCFCIGKFTVFGPDIKVITGQHPTENIVSLYPAFYSVRAQMGFTYVQKSIFEEFKYADRVKKYKVIVGNDVWIGAYTRIMEGVTIGDGAIIAAGSLVIKDIPPYAVCGGGTSKDYKI